MISYYTYRGDGRRLPSVVVVASREGVSARLLAERWAEENDIAPGSMRLDGINVEPQPSVVYAWDGDY